jgi:hypothetical protein
MKIEPSAFASNRESDAPSWLWEQVYAPKKQRTLDLVTQSIEHLRKERQRISLASITAISKTIDPTGQGVSESAVLNNENARALYEQHRTWKGSPRRTTTTSKKVKAPRISTKAGRDQEQVRQRYLRMGKAELVDRLLAVEAAYAEQEQRWLSQQDEVLIWRLRAEQAEGALSKETGSRREKRDQRCCQGTGSHDMLE